MDRWRITPLSALKIFAATLLLTCLFLALLSTRFEVTDAPRSLQQRPLIAVLGCFAIAFALYLGATFTALRCRPNRALVRWIVLPAIAFRVVLLFSLPIQEVDIYRYLWDGAVTMEGVSPYRYSPEQVATARSGDAMPHDLARLVALRDATPELASVLDRVHFGYLPTIYPATSQAVFAVVSAVTPARATVYQRIVLMKLFLIGFDLATLGLVFGLLRTAGRHLGWAVAYGWCPLLLKEVANSGHLDAIAVFFCTAAILALLRFLAPNETAPIARATDRTLPRPERRRPERPWRGCWAALLLAFAVGAKLYPIVLAPWFLGLSVSRRGWRHAWLGSVVFLGLTILLLMPMVPNPCETDDVTQDPSAGLTTFLTQWEMNDWWFMVMIENVRPAPEVAEEARPPEPWFSVVPNTWRPPLVDRVKRQASVDAPQASFYITRGLTGTIFLVFAIAFAWRATRTAVPSVWLEMAFLTVAWFWLLSPTQNPWYWTWALPLLAFARSPLWMAVSGLTLIYYLRFWFEIHVPDNAILGTDYRGTLFFDYVIVALEFVPWMLCLALFWGWPHAKRKHPPTASCQGRVLTVD